MPAYNAPQHFLAEIEELTEEAIELLIDMGKVDYLTQRRFLNDRLSLPTLSHIEQSP